MTLNIYQNKQGKSKGIAKETTVLLVKNLTAYITKLAESESEELDLTSGELPLCFDAEMQVEEDSLQSSHFSIGNMAR